jgi:hypothetical protein
MKERRTYFAQIGIEASLSGATLKTGTCGALELLVEFALSGNLSGG